MPGLSTCQAGQRSGDPLYLDGPEIAVFEEIANQPARGRGDDDCVRFGQRLQPGGEVGRLANDRLLLRGALADQIANDHQPGGDLDPRLELDRFNFESADSVGHTQPECELAHTICIF
jgi:hypothetical protein